MAGRQLRSSALFVVEDDEEEEVPVHTAASPYCGKLGCWCHTDVQYHEEVTAAFSLGEVDEQYECALSLLGGSS